MYLLAYRDREAVGGSCVHGNCEESLHSSSFSHLCLINPAGTCAGVGFSWVLEAVQQVCLKHRHPQKISVTAQGFLTWSTHWLNLHCGLDHDHIGQHIPYFFSYLGHLRCLCCIVQEAVLHQCGGEYFSLCPACELLQKLAWEGCAILVAWERKALVWAPLTSLEITMVHVQTHSLYSLHNLTSKGRKTSMLWQESPV